MFRCRVVSIPAMASLILAGAVSALAAEGGASWLLDAAKYHISVHGQLSCATCHEDVAGRPLHPDPRNVTQQPAASAALKQCFSCHDQVQAGLKKHQHGGMPADNPADFEDCTTCHDPHYQLKSADESSGRLTGKKAAREQCGVCHAARKALPKAAAADERCASCHAIDAAKVTKVSTLCFHCHGNQGTQAQRITGGFTALIDAAAYAKRAPHAGQACTVCHPAATTYGHLAAAPVECRQCHSPHYAKLKEDPHFEVDCKACHLGGGKPVQAGTQLVTWEAASKPGTLSRMHDMKVGKESCVRCHYVGNRLGAAAMVLPAKSVICMPCHTGHVKSADTTTIASLLIFLFGLVGAVSFWLSGSRPGKFHGGAAAICGVLRTLVLDVLGQRRLLRQSRLRWAIHSLIFLPFVLRCGWGIVALAASHFAGRSTWYVFMLDKNHPANALFFDLTGVLILAGICAAIVRGMVQKAERVPGLPRQDYIALGLIGSVVVIGFLLEGMRIAMTGATGTAAFLGYAISRAFSGGPALAGFYGYVWYLHAILMGAFVAYLPFGRMFHIILAPVVLSIRAARESGHAAVTAGD